MPGFPHQDPRTFSQFLQEELRLRSHSAPKKPSSESIGGGLGETFAKMSQVYRQRVTHLESDEGSGAKDEKEQRRECKAELPALTCGGCAPTFGQTTHKRKGLLLLNPATDRQFLTLLKDVKRLQKIAEVTNTTPITIYDIVGSGIIENRAMYVK